MQCNTFLDILLPHFSLLWIKSLTPEQCQSLHDKPLPELCTTPKAIAWEFKLENWTNKDNGLLFYIGTVYCFILCFISLLPGLLMCIWSMKDNYDFVWHRSWGSLSFCNAHGSFRYYPKQAFSRINEWLGVGFLASLHLYWVLRHNSTLRCLEVNTCLMSIKPAVI